MKQSNNERLLSGNEALARGAIEAGIGFCASYPGTPSTEITTELQNVAEEHNLYVEWSVNEKVAVESAAGASWAGVPAMSAMKSLGMNVASDFLLNLNLSGSGKGGLVIVVCDDPRGHSSSNEQDSRFYAKAAQIPLLEPSTYQEAKDLVPYALKISQDFEIPVIIRSTTRLSHSSGLVKLGHIPERKWSAKIPRRNLFNVPNPHYKHQQLLDKMQKISEQFSRTKWNKKPVGTNNEILIVSSGVSHRYSREAIQLLSLDCADTLKLVTTYPLPEDLVASSLSIAKAVLFSEEIDPFIENEVRALSVNQENRPRFHGKRTGIIPAYGEMTTDIMKSALLELLGEKGKQREQVYPDLLASRPLTFCAGCTHRNVYWAIRKVRKRLGEKLFVAGDIGCYSLGVFYDDAMNSMQAMGSGIGVASGLGQLERFGLDEKIIAVAGDSTFFHACIPGLVNAKHKGADLTFIILDNATTAMTGFQVHPGSKYQNKNLRRVKIENIVQSLDPDYYAKGDATDIPSLIELLYSTVKLEGLKVLILDSICRLEEGRREIISEKNPVMIDENLCRGESCKICSSEFSCPAISWDIERKCPIILDQLCINCLACIEICPHNAIKAGETE